MSYPLGTLNFIYKLIPFPWNIAWEMWLNDYEIWHPIEIIWFICSIIIESWDNFENHTIIYNHYLQYKVQPCMSVFSSVRQLKFRIHIKNPCTNEHPVFDTFGPLVCHSCFKSYKYFFLFSTTEHKITLYVCPNLIIWSFATCHPWFSLLNTYL